MIEIKELSKEEYQGKPFVARYKTTGYYDLEIQDDCFRLVYRKFGFEKEMSFEDCFFGQWLENPVGYGAFENGRLLGYIEGCLETWNNRYRISNLCIFEEADRRKGLGAMLMDKLLETAKASGARMAVLETQTCNENAIAFYKKHGFRVIGFDLFAYTNQDLERKEVRLEMGGML